MNIDRAIVSQAACSIFHENCVTYILYSTHILMPWTLLGNTAAVKSVIDMTFQFQTIFGAHQREENIRTMFFPAFEISRSFFQPIQHGEKSGNFKNQENRVLEKYSNIFFHSRLEQGQYKNASIWSKAKLAFNLPPFFTRQYCEEKRATISKLTCTWTPSCHSKIVFTLHIYGVNSANDSKIFFKFCFIKNIQHITKILCQAFEK